MTHARLSHNTITTRYWPLRDLLAGVAEAGIGTVGLWREPVQEVGLDVVANTLRGFGLEVSSLCRGGFFPAQDDVERHARRADNRSAVDEASALGADVLILVCGGVTSTRGGLEAARQQVMDGIAELVPYAAARGVRLAIEPLHPMFAADRSVVVTLGQALDLAENFPPDEVGVAVDTFHVWWDPEVWQQIRRAAGRIHAFQVCDWLDPLPDVLLGRGMPGDGVIDIRRFVTAVSDAGYDGPIEVEIFNRKIWQMPGPDVLAQVVARFERLLSN